MTPKVITKLQKYTCTVKLIESAGSNPVLVFIDENDLSFNAYPGKPADVVNFLQLMSNLGEFKYKMHGAECTFDEMFIKALDLIRDCQDAIGGL